jgi:GMC oxidoreductase
MAYLAPVRHRANLQVVSEALAMRILFDGRRATAVEFVAVCISHVATANAEVIVDLQAATRVPIRHWIKALDERLTGRNSRVYLYFHTVPGTRP